MLEFERYNVSLGRTIRPQWTKQSAIAFLNGMESVWDICPAVNEKMPKLGLYRKINLVQARNLLRAREVLNFERSKIRQLRNAK